MSKKPAESGTLYAVTRRGKHGEETIEVRAHSGDEAATKAAKDAHVIVGVTPA